MNAFTFLSDSTELLGENKFNSTKPYKIPTDLSVNPIYIKINLYGVFLKAHILYEF